MSNAPQNNGWWQAQDGHWYPPEQHPDPDYRRQVFHHQDAQDPTVEYYGTVRFRHDRISPKNTRIMWITISVVLVLGIVGFTYTQMTGQDESQSTPTTQSASGEDPAAATDADDPAQLFLNNLTPSRVRPENPTEPEAIEYLLGIKEDIDAAGHDFCAYYRASAPYRFTINPILGHATAEVFQTMISIIEIYSAKAVTFTESASERQLWQDYHDAAVLMNDPHIAALSVGRPVDSAHADEANRRIYEANLLFDALEDFPSDEPGGTEIDQRAMREC